MGSMAASVASAERALQVIKASFLSEGDGSEAPASSKISEATASSDAASDVSFSILSDKLAPPPEATGQSAAAVTAAAEPPGASGRSGSSAALSLLSGASLQ